MKLLRVENAYNVLVQVDYLVGLTAAFLLGSEKWTMFFSALVLSLILGWVTVRTYIRLQSKIVREAQRR